MLTQKIINDKVYKIIGCAIEVHKTLGPGLLESVYHKCFKRELELNGFNVRSEANVEINYKGISVSADLRIDFIVDDLVGVEIKAVDNLLPVFKCQTLSYLKLLSIPKGLLINFNCENISNSLVPFVTEDFAKLPKE